jgi:hypothetical protein
MKTDSHLSGIGMLDGLKADVVDEDVGKVVPRGGERQIYLAGKVGKLMVALAVVGDHVVDLCRFITIRRVPLEERGGRGVGGNKGDMLDKITDNMLNTSYPNFPPKSEIGGVGGGGVGSPDSGLNGSKPSQNLRDLIFAHNNLEAEIEIWEVFRHFLGRGEGGG